MTRCCICGKAGEETAVPVEFYQLIEERYEDKPVDGYVCKACSLKDSGVKTLYHISNWCEITPSFIPRIPHYRASEEDKTTPRISLSNSIEGCLTAVPWGNSRLEQIFWEYGSFLIRVYEFKLSEMDTQKLLTPEYLYYTDKVRDANVTKEYWYLDALIPSKTYLIDLSDYSEDSEGWVSCKDVMDYLREVKNGNESEVNYEDSASSWFANIEEVKFNKVPESRRSGVFRLNHPIQGITLKDSISVTTRITSLYPTERTWVNVEERNGKFYVVGEVDTRWLGSTDCSGEIDSRKIIRYFNQNLDKGRIIQKKGSV